MTVTAAKSAASLFLPTDRTEDGAGKSPSLCRELERAAVGTCGRAGTEAREDVLAGPGPKKNLHDNKETYSILLNSELILH